MDNISDIFFVIFMGTASLAMLALAAACVFGILNSFGGC